MKGQLKAIVAGVIAALSFAIPVVDDGVVPSEVGGILLAGVIAWQSVYWIKNGGVEE